VFECKLIIGFILNYFDGLGFINITVHHRRVYFVFKIVDEQSRKKKKQSQKPKDFIEYIFLFDIQFSKIVY